MTGAEIVAALSALVAAIMSLDVVQTRRDNRRFKAIRELSNAVTATEGQVADSSVNPEASYKLTNAWHQASLAFRDAGDDETARLCRIKGNYWLDPANWSDEQVSEAGIRLVEMRSALNSLMADS